jgi:beta-N-acetylhexosaminidase
VARLAEPIACSVQEHGLAACAKHFAGDGVDDVDQRTVTSVNHPSRQEWGRVSGFPLRRAVDSGVWSVMVGHMTLPAWDGSQNTFGVYRPASICHTLVTGLLREELGFQGIIVTDDMNMGGVAGYARRWERTVARIVAAGDMLLFPKRLTIMPAHARRPLRNPAESACAVGRRHRLGPYAWRRPARAGD